MYRRTRSVVFRLALLVTLLIATRANAAPPSPADVSCITGMNKAGGKAAAASLANAYACARLTRLGYLPQGVSALDCLDMDVKGAVAKAESKASAVDLRRCDAPAFGYAGASAVNDAGRQLASSLVADVFGNGFAETKLVLPCQQQVLRELSTLAVAELRAFTSCKQRGLTSGMIDDAASLSGCLAAFDATGDKLERLRAGLADIESLCGPFDFNFLFPGYCVFESDLAPCLDTRVRCRACEALNQMDNLSMDCETFDNGVADGSCGACVPDPDGVCCSAADKDACGFCGGTGFRCDWAKVSVAGPHACGLKSDGSIACWGHNFAGELDHPSGTFVDIASGGSVAEATNKGHSCAIDTNQNVTCWGRNDYGQASPPAGAFTQLAAGTYHTCGLHPDGTIQCWGSNLYGESSPPSGTYQKITSSHWGNCALRTDGEVACWGRVFGYSTMTPIPGPFTDIELGGIAAYAIRPDQTLAYWGGDDLPQFIPPAGEYMQVASANVDGCALALDGSIVAWPQPPVMGPPNVPPPTGAFLSIDGGDRIYCGIRSDHILMCWGDTYTQSGAPPK